MRALNELEKTGSGKAGKDCGCKAKETPDKAMKGYLNSRTKIRRMTYGLFH